MQGDVPPPAQSMKLKMLKFLNNTYRSIFFKCLDPKIYYLEVFFCPKTLSFWQYLGGGGGSWVSLGGGKLSCLEGKLPLRPPP